MKTINLSDITDQCVSHNPKIPKKVLLERGEIPHLLNLSVARFPKNENAPSHKHDDMYEVFMIQSGEGEIVVDYQTFKLEAGVCVIVAPGEFHELKNTGDKELVATCIGIKN